MKKNLFCRVMALFAAAVLLIYPRIVADAAPRLQDTGDKLVIVIDPGHGGGNRGTLENNHEEKFMTMTTAQAMYDELTKYDDVEVYLTRTSDVDMELKERAEFAASVDADFMFSIHYNASANHELYGSEVWVSLVPPYNGYGLQFGYEFLTEMRERGLFVRGVKTRIGDNGDYYGIIRESVALDLPALIIEHCHVDNDNDAEYCDSDADLKAFGIADATAVAKYFGLKSSQLNVDYSGYSLIEASGTSINSLTRRDDTKPEFCEISLNSADYENNKLYIDVMAADYDSLLLYYAYSLDGGNTFSAREPWPGCDTLSGTYTDTFTLELDIPENMVPQVILRAYNFYDLYMDSNMLAGLKAFTASSASESSKPQPDEIEDDNLPATGNALAASQSASEESSEPAVSQSVVEGGSESAELQLVTEVKTLPGTTTFRPAVSQTVEEEKEVSFLNFLKLCLVFVVILFIAVLISQSVTYHKKKQKRRYQRRNDDGDSRNQLR